MDFLPEGYKEPSATSRYFKLKEPGTQSVRILESATPAYCGFTDKVGDQKPKPVRNLGNDPQFWLKNGVDPTKVRHVWIVPVWNNSLGCVQVWEITQKSVRDAIKAYATNPKWGHPAKYDLAVTREGTGIDDTVWTVIAEPHSELPAEAMAAWDEAKANGFNIYRMLDGGDPFGEAGGF